jgi:hypothetical protein
MARIPLIGFHSANPRSGKSTVALAGMEVFDGTVLSIATAVRDVARRCDMEAAANAVGDDKDIALDELDGQSPRQVLVGIGEAMVRQFGLDFWIDIVIDEARQIIQDGGGVFIDDVRRMSEAQRVVDVGGEMFSLVLPGSKRNDVDINSWQPSDRHLLQNDRAPRIVVAEAVARCPASVLRRFASRVSPVFMAQIGSLQNRVVSS